MAVGRWSWAWWHRSFPPIAWLLRSQQARGSRPTSLCGSRAWAERAGPWGQSSFSAVYLLGHSVTSCFLLLAWGWLSFANFAFMIPADFAHSGGSAQGQACLRNVRQQVGAFAVLGRFVCSTHGLKSGRNLALPMWSRWFSADASGRRRAKWLNNLATDSTRVTSSTQPPSPRLLMEPIEPKLHLTKRTTNLRPDSRSCHNLNMANMAEREREMYR